MVYRVIFEFYLTAENLLAYKVPLYIDILGPSIEFWILSKCNYSLIICLYGDRYLRRLIAKIQLCKQSSDPNSFLGSLRLYYIFGLAGG